MIRGPWAETVTVTVTGTVAVAAAAQRSLDRGGDCAVARVGLGRYNGGAMGSLSLEAVAVEIGGRRLLEGLDLTLEAGQRVAVTGPSGGGKTTLLRAIAGLVDFAEGQARLDGRTPEELGWPAWRRRVTYVAQLPVLLDGTVRDNLVRPFAFRHVPGPFPEERVRGWLGELGLAEDRLEQLARTLSVGEQQRVALVRSLAVRPDVVLLDEPTSALDEEAAEAVERLLGRWCDEQGGALVAVTHDPVQAERLASRRLDLREHAPRSADAA